MDKSITTDCYSVINEISINSLVTNQQMFELLKNRMSFAINSARVLYYIGNLKELLVTLRKRSLIGTEKEEALQLILEFINTSEKRRDRLEHKIPFHVLDIVAEEVGKRWLDMARHLNISDGTIAEIEAKYHFSLKQQAYQALLVYCNEVNVVDIKSKLLDSLTKIRRVDLRSKVERELCKEDSTKVFS